MIISGTMIATSTGVGLWTWMTTLVFGVPMATVASLVIPGALLIALATMNFSFTNGMTTSIAAAYKLLDRHIALAALTDKAPSRAKRVLPSKAKGGTKQANAYDVAAMSILKTRREKSSVKKEAASLS